MNKTTGGRRRRLWPQLAAVPAVAAGLVLLTAACGSSTSSSTSASHASAASVPAGLAFAQCMRAHGLSNFPDPNADGQEPSSAKTVVTGNPRFPAAYGACRYIVRSDEAAVQQADQREYVSFAGCMRTHGVPEFPDPITQSNGDPVFNLSPVGLDVQAPQVRSAAATCQAQLHLSQTPSYEGSGS